MRFWMLCWLMAEIHVHGMGKSRGRNPARPYGCVSACHPSSCLPQQGQASSLFRVIPRPVAVMSHPFPAQTPCFPETPSSCAAHTLHSHPTCLQPLVLQGRESISLPPPFDGLWQIAGAKQIAVPAKNHRCRGAGAGSIAHPGNCICLCQKGLGAEAALLAQLQASGDMAQANSPPAAYPRERHVIPQVLITLQQVLKKVKERHTYVNIRGRHKAGQYLALQPCKGGT